MKLTKYAERHKNKHLEIFARSYGNSKFDASFHDDDVFPYLPNLPAGYVYSPGSGVAMAMKSVEAHYDDMVGECIKGHKFACASFGLTKGYCTIHVGNEFLRLRAGDWVMFDDGIAHSVYATAKWYGFAVQVLKKNKPRSKKIIVNNEGVSK